MKTKSTVSDFSFHSRFQCALPHVSLMAPHSGPGISAKVCLVEHSLSVRVDHGDTWLAAGLRDATLACCWPRRAFVFLHFFSSADSPRQCVRRLSGSRVSEQGFNSTGRFSQSITCFTSMKLHTCRIDCSAWPFHVLSLANIHHVSSLTESWSRFLGLCIALKYTLTCSTSCLDSIVGSFSRYRTASVDVSSFVPRMPLVASHRTLPSSLRLHCDRNVEPGP